MEEFKDFKVLVVSFCLRAKRIFKNLEVFLKAFRVDSGSRVLRGFKGRRLGFRIRGSRFWVQGSRI